MVEMAIIQTFCPGCGEVRMAPENVWINSPEQYAFTCPGCKKGVLKRADENIISLLLAAGVQTIDEIIDLETVDF